MHDTSFMFYQGLLPAAAGSADSRAGIPASVSPGQFTGKFGTWGESISCMIHLLCFIRGRGRHPCVTRAIHSSGHASDGSQWFESITSSYSQGYIYVDLPARGREL